LPPIRHRLGNSHNRGEDTFTDDESVKLRDAQAAYAAACERLNESRAELSRAAGTLTQITGFLKEANPMAWPDIDLSRMPTAADLRSMMDRISEDSAAVMFARYELERLGIPFVDDLLRPLEIPSNQKRG
jgi:hypothetical protein